MPSKNTHAIRGFLAGLREYEETKRVQGGPTNFFEALVHGAVGYLGGIFPDWIEPATGPSHRRYFHSGEFLLYLGGAYQNNPNSVVRAGLRGAAQHLVDDAETPAGLPSGVELALRRMGLL